ncbi:MAG: penicillin acylase family protein [Acidobacteriota bacterium]
MAKRSLAGRWLRGIGLALLILGLPLLIVATLGGFWLRGQLRASLPQLSGELTVAGIEAAVTIDRDQLGVPTLRGTHRVDLAYGLGFLHGQERFFQMDLQRRQAAGELSELFGPATFGADRRARRHGFRQLAAQVFGQSPGSTRRLLTAYADGVNAGLDALDASPVEYLLLRQGPEPWRPEDSVLTLYAMFELLQRFGIQVEEGLSLLSTELTPDLYQFLTASGDGWDAPLLGQVTAAAALPPATAVAAHRPPPPGSFDTAAAHAVPGSNNWAVAGALTAHGGALLATDMHLPLSLPNIWYRARLEWPGHEVTGGTLPGAPLVVIGSNGHVAWGFTNSRVDTSDIVLLEIHPEDPDSYLTPDGWRRFDRRLEVLRAKGGKEESLEVLSTVWGPVIDDDVHGHPRALAWVAHHPDAVGFELAALESARSTSEALDIANGAGLPTQNIVVADTAGQIGWTLAGRLPRRYGFDGQTPTSWANGSRGWDGLVDAREIPRLVDPVDHRLWTANNRLVDGDWLALLGDGGYVSGARAGLIRDRLFELETATVEDMLRIQLDDSARFLDRWRNLFLDLLDEGALAENPARGDFRRLIEDWEGRASVSSRAYRLVRGARQFLLQDLLQFLTAPCAELDPSYAYLNALPRSEGPLWALVTERPEHLLNPKYSSWEAQLLAGVDQVVAYYGQIGADLEAVTWGNFNRVQLRHPISLAVPQLGRWLDLPVAELPGDFNMPRVQQPGYGASQRMAVAPGREEEGIFHMPGGQSGHPLSPHYGDSNRAWVEGTPTSFLPGPTTHTLTLQPAR